MKCKVKVSELIDVLDSNSENYLKLNLHVKECPECKNKIEILQNQMQYLEIFKDVSPTNELADRIYSNTIYSQNSDKYFGNGVLSLSLAKAISFASIILVSIFGGYFLGNSNNSIPQPKSESPLKRFVQRSFVSISSDRIESEFTKYSKNNYENK